MNRELSPEVAENAKTLGRIFGKNAEYYFIQNYKPNGDLREELFTAMCHAHPDQFRFSVEGLFIKTN